MNNRPPKNNSNSLVLKIIYYSWQLLLRGSVFIFHEFKRFFSVPKNSRSGNLWLTTLYRINSMGLWCAIGIAIIHLIYYLIVISNPQNLPNFDIQLHGEGAIIALQNFNYRTAKYIQELGFHLINAILFTLFLIFWLYIHYTHEHLSRKISLVLCIFYVIGNNLEGLTSLSTSFGDVWLIMAPVIIIPAVGNRRGLPLLLVNLFLHHAFVSYEPDPYDMLTSIASFFVSIFIMMMQMEYYRREARLQDSANRLRERVLEIELIKENMDSGLMLLNLELKVRPNFSDKCIKLLHKKNLRDEYLPKLLRNIVEENQYFINSMNYYNDSEGEEYKIDNPDEWQERVEHYFAMLKTEQLDDDELSCIDPLKFIKIYSYEGRSYISFHVSPIKVNGQIQYFMVLIGNDTGKVAGRYRIMEHERKYLERAQLLFALSHDNPNKQSESLGNFAQRYLTLCKIVLTEVRSTTPPMQLVKIVSEHLKTMHSIFGNLNLEQYQKRVSQLLQECREFSQIKMERSSNVFIINKSTQNCYIQLIVNIEHFLHEMRSLFSIATFFIREPSLAEELQQQKQALHYGLSKDTLQEQPERDFYDTQMSSEKQMFINLYTAFEMLLLHHDLQRDFKFLEQKYASPQDESPMDANDESEPI